jgi:hypothetical protein
MDEITYRRCSKERPVLEQGSTCLLNIGFVRSDDTRYVGKVPSSPVFFLTLRYTRFISQSNIVHYKVDVA